MLYEDEEMKDITAQLTALYSERDDLQSEIKLEEASKAAAVKDGDRKAFKKISKALSKLVKRRDDITAEINRMTDAKKERARIVAAKIHDAYTDELDVLQMQYNEHAERIRALRMEHAEAIQEAGNFVRESKAALLNDYRTTRKAHGLNPFGNVNAVNLKEAPLFEPNIEDVAAANPLSFTQTQIRSIYQNEIMGE